MLDIQSLSSQVEQLKTNVAWWNNWVVRLLWFTALVLGLTFIIGTVYAVFSRIALKKSEELASAQTALDHEKDEQLNRDLKSKDLSISAADQKAADAKKETARLTKEAEQAKTERAEADKQIAIAKADAARAKEGIANAEAVSAKASVEVARLQVVVAKEGQRQKRRSWRSRSELSHAT